MSILHKINHILTRLCCIFSPQAFQLPFKMSTSQTPTRIWETGIDVEFLSCGGGFGAVCKEGYGVCYIHLGDDLGKNFVGSSFLLVGKVVFRHPSLAGTYYGIVRPSFCLFVNCVRNSFRIISFLDTRYIGRYLPTLLKTRSATYIHIMTQFFTGGRWAYVAIVNCFCWTIHNWTVQLA